MIDSYSRRLSEIVSESSQSETVAHESNHPASFFDFAFYSRADLVIYSFIVIIAFNIGAELLLDRLERYADKFVATIL